MARTRRPAPAEPARPLPHPRVPATKYIQLILTLGRFGEPCHVRELDAVTDIGLWRIGISMKFLVQCGLAEKVSGRGIYQPAPASQGIARACAKGQAEGLSALRTVWQDQWFARSARDRLADGSAPRAALGMKFIRQVQTPGYEKGVDRLIDLMVETGFLVAEPDDFVTWHEHATLFPRSSMAPCEGVDSPPDPEGSSTEGPTESSVDVEGPSVPDEGRHSGPSSPDEPTDTSTQDEHRTTAEETVVPGPRQGGHREDVSVSGNNTEKLSGGDVEKLLAEHLGLGEVWHMTTGEAATLHDHLTGLLAVLSAMRTRQRENDTPLKAELLTPLWPLGGVAAMDRGDWLTTHRLIHQLGAAAPLRKEPVHP
ncbi:hypothetical protein IPZ58_26650 [Streptomyces roseoverticillatus]|uniref:hypothetical protein n=1 Tax=Streptomyces roseoverticillatus TaxID=66429 RepID=UPI001F46B118|nr:hypothetical protein [Streptomyces roseoverticillatus]MCF3105144.1 hypothetical protein [Streptomyces roseoverticillatus]